MMSKFNWGHGIALFYIVFVGVLLYALISSFGVDHSLVVDDYYQKDIEYQSRYDKEVRALSSKNISVVSDQNTGEVVITIDDAVEVEGTVLFYRPSDKSKDFTLKVNKATTRIPVEKFEAGKWIVKMDCTVDGKAFYKEEVLFI